MSIQDGKVFLYISKRKNAFVVGVLLTIQLILSVILSISLAGNLIWPEQSSAAAGSPMKIAYEGRLTDSSGNALGGAGTVYCYRFSIYDASTAGNKLWPGGTPSNTTATTTDGVFNAVIGQADTLSSTVFDFSTTSTAYLQVEVNTTTSTCGGSWEALLPRQQVLSSGYAMQSANVYGSLLKTDTVNNWVQVGAGGQANPIELVLDANNSTSDYVGQTCSTVGAMWYNTVTTQALICVNGVVESLGNSGSTTIAAVQTNSNTPISNGTVVFSNSNGVTFGNNAGTITASVNAAGAALSSYANALYKLNSQTQQGLVSTFVVFPFVLSGNVSFDYLRILNSVSIASTSFASTANTTYSYNQAISFRGVLYSKNVGASSMSLASVSTFSAGMTYSLNAAYGSATNTSQILTMGITYPISTGTSSFTTVYNTSNLSTQALSTTNFTRLTGFKFMDFPFAGSLSAGDYWLALNASTTQTTQAVAALSAVRLLFSTIGMSQVNNTYAYFGNFNTGSVQAQRGVGSFTTVGGASTGSMGFSNISSSASHPIPYLTLQMSNYAQ